MVSVCIYYLQAKQNMLIRYVIHEKKDKQFVIKMNIIGIRQHLRYDCTPMPSCFYLPKSRCGNKSLFFLLRKMTLMLTQTSDMFRKKR